MQFFILSALTVFFVYLFLDALKSNHLVILLFLFGNLIPLSSFFFFSFLRNNLYLLATYGFVFICIYISMSLAMGTSFFKPSLVPTSPRIIADRYSYCDLVMLVVFGFAFIVTLPDIKRFSSYDYLEFQTGAFYLSSTIDYTLTIATFVVLCLFIYQKRVSILGFLSVSLILLIRPFIFFVSGFRFPFLGGILFFFASLLLFSGLNPYKRLTTFVSSLLNIRIHKSSLKSITIVIAFLGLFAVIFASITGYRNTGTLSLFKIESLILLVFYETASGASYSLEKLLISFQFPPPSQVLESSCLIFNQSYPSLLPRSLWQALSEFFSSDTSCQSVSTMIKTNNFVVFGEGSGTAASLFADFYHYFGYLFIFLIFFYVLSIIFLSFLLEKVLRAGLSSFISRAFFVSSFFFISPLIIFWRLDIYSIFPLSTFIVFLLLMAPRLILSPINR